jgi:hypothetical protein
MDEDWPLTLRFWLLTAKPSVACGTNDLVALLDQIEKMGRLRRGSEIRPIRVLELGNIPERLERECRVRDAEMPHNDDGVFVCATGLFG